MKLPTAIRKWGSGVLGAVSLLLLLNLVMKIRGMDAPVAPSHSVPTVTSAPTKKASPRPTDDLAIYDPAVHVEILKGSDARPLPDLDRNIFDFVAPPAPVVAPLQVAVVQQPVLPPAPPPPPPPPPVLLKAVGYNSMQESGKAALTSLKDQVFLVREGDVVAARYKILKITPASLMVEDAETHRTVDLPFPQ